MFGHRSTSLCSPSLCIVPVLRERKEKKEKKINQAAVLLVCHTVVKALHLSSSSPSGGQLSNYHGAAGVAVCSADGFIKIATLRSATVFLHHSHHGQYDRHSRPTRSAQGISELLTALSTYSRSGTSQSGSPSPASAAYRPTWASCSEAGG